MEKKLLRKQIILRFNFSNNNNNSALYRVVYKLCKTRLFRKKVSDK